MGSLYTAERTEGGGSPSAQIGGSLLRTGANLGIARGDKPSTTERAVAEVPLTVEQLGQYLGKANSNLVVEDLHKAPKSTKAAIAEAMKLFMDLSAEFPTLKIIALGARETAEDILHFDDEMKNRVAEVAVAAMSESELKEILAKGGRCLNVDFPPVVANRMTFFACGMPAVVHQLALTMCSERGITNTISAGSQEPLSAEVLSTAIDHHVMDHAASFRSDFEAATRTTRKSKYDNYRTIMHALSQKPSGLMRAELLDSIRHRYKKYPASNLDQCLKRLISDEERGNLIVQDPTTRRYKFKHPQACAYAAMRFAAAKWADFCITAADTKNGSVNQVGVLRDEGPSLSDEQTWNRAELIDAMLKGTTFVTTVMGLRP